MAHSNGYYAAINCLSLTRVVLSCFYRVLFIPKAFLFTSLSLSVGKDPVAQFVGSYIKKLAHAYLAHAYAIRVLPTMIVSNIETWFIDLQ